MQRNQAAKSPQYGCTRTQDRGKLPLDQIETFSVVVHKSQFNKFSHADGLKSIPLLKKKFAEHPGLGSAPLASPLALSDP